jgi:hypothetical protein
VSIATRLDKLERHVGGYLYRPGQCRRRMLTGLHLAGPGPLPTAEEMLPCRSCGGYHVLVCELQVVGGEGNGS